MEDESCDERTPDKGREEPYESDDPGLLPFADEYLGIKFGARQKGQEDRACAGKERHPLGSTREGFGSNERADDQLGDRADDDLAERRRELEPDGEERRDERQSDPDRRNEPHVLHKWSFSDPLRARGTLGGQTPPSTSS